MGKDTDGIMTYILTIVIGFVFGFALVHVVPRRQDVFEICTGICLSINVSSMKDAASKHVHNSMLCSARPRGFVL